MRKLVLAAVLAAAMVPAGVFAAEKITNETVITLTQAGLGDEAIIAKIEGSDTAFDLSTSQMVELKQKGVSGPVIAAMLKRSSALAGGRGAMSLDSIDPMVPHPAGVYLVMGGTAGDRMQRLDPTVSTQAKTGGIMGYAFTGGIASMSVKASIQNDAARYNASTSTPTFYFFFDEANGQSNTFAAGVAATVTAPSEFTLVQLTPKKGRRETRVGSINVGGAKTGVMDKDRLAFDYEMVRPGVYKVTPKRPLESGQYGFIYSLTGGGGAGALTARIFDFGVN